MFRAKHASNAKTLPPRCQASSGIRPNRQNRCSSRAAPASRLCGLRVLCAEFQAPAPRLTAPVGSSAAPATVVVSQRRGGCTRGEGSPMSRHSWCRSVALFNLAAARRSRDLDREVIRRSAWRRTPRLCRQASARRDRRSPRCPEPTTPRPWWCPSSRACPACEVARVAVRARLAVVDRRHHGPGSRG